MASASHFSPSLSPSISNKSSENNLLSILSISIPPSPSPSPSLPASNPNFTTSPSLLSNHDLTLLINSPPSLTIIPPPTPACAACKYQRRKCGPTCPLAPFFPAGRNEQFLHVHRLFGVRNIVKALKAIQPDERHNAVESFIFEADARASDPSGGCLRIVLELENHLKRLNDELSLVKSHIAFYQAQVASTSRGITTTSPNEDHENEGDNVGSAVVPLLDGNQNPENQEEQRIYDYFSYNGNNTNYNNMNINTNNNMVNNINVELIESDNNGSGSDDHVNNQNEERVSSEDELRPFVDVFGLCGRNSQEEEEEEEGKLVQNNGDVADCGRELDLPMHCDLGLGFSSF